LSVMLTRNADAFGGVGSAIETLARGGIKGDIASASHTLNARQS